MYEFVKSKAINMWFFAVNFDGQYWIFKDFYIDKNSSPSKIIFFFKIIAWQFTFLFIVQWFRQSQFRIEKDSDWKYDPHKGNEWISKIIWQLNMLPSSLFNFYTGNCLLLRNVFLNLSLGQTASNLNSYLGKKTFLKPKI